MIAVIQIGNSDNKLTQQEWANYVHDIRVLLESHNDISIHFFGGSVNYEPWQNVCWVFDVPDSDLNAIESEVSRIRYKWKQDSAAITTGSTRFI